MALDKVVNVYGHKKWTRISCLLGRTRKLAVLGKVSSGQVFELMVTLVCHG